MKLNYEKSEARANPYTMACKSIMTLTVVAEEKPSVRWREMLNDAKLEVRRILGRVEDSTIWC